MLRNTNLPWLLLLYIVIIGLTLFTTFSSFGKDNSESSNGLELTEQPELTDENERELNRFDAVEKLLDERLMLLGTLIPEIEEGEREAALARISEIDAELETLGERTITLEEVLQLHEKSQNH